MSSVEADLSVPPTHNWSTTWTTAAQPTIVLFKCLAVGLWEATFTVGSIHTVGRSQEENIFIRSGVRE